jgi:hypothetical protein
MCQPQSKPPHQPHAAPLTNSDCRRGFSNRVATGNGARVFELPGRAVETSNQRIRIKYLRFLDSGFGKQLSAG